MPRHDKLGRGPPVAAWHSPILPGVRPLPPALRHALADQGRGLSIVVIRLAAMGDILRTLPPVRLLRRALPRARIYWVVDDRWQSLLEGHPDLDGLVAFPRKLWQQLARSPTGWPKILASLARLRTELRRLEPDLVLDFHGNLRSGLTSRLSGAPVRLGYEGHQQKEINHWFNTHHRASGSRRTPRMERNLDLVRALGIPDAPLPDAGLPMLSAGHERASEIVGELFEGREYAVISPGASAAQAAKKPPSSVLSAACRTLAGRDVGALVVWGPGEEEDARAVTNDPHSGATLAPATDLPTLAALIDGARLFIGGDSGPLHLACAVGCPVVGIYGPTDPEVNAPWGVPHRVVFPEGRHYTGIKRIDREAGGFQGLQSGQVQAAVEELVEAARESTSVES